MPKKPTSTKKRATPAAKSRTGTVRANCRDSRATKTDGKPGLQTKADTILRLLRRKGGASVAEMAGATGWQAHSVRGFLSGTVKKKFGLTLEDEMPEGGPRRYFVRAAS